MKKPEGKPKLSYLYTCMMEQVARVREFGVKKHGTMDGWKTTKPIEHFEAAERHIRAAMDGEWEDKESGLSHAAHAICNLMFEIERNRLKEKFIFFRNQEPTTPNVLNGEDVTIPKVYPSADQAEKLLSKIVSGNKQAIKMTLSDRFSSKNMDKEKKK